MALEGMTCKPHDRCGCHHGGRRADSNSIGTPQSSTINGTLEIRMKFRPLPQPAANAVMEWSAKGSPRIPVLETFDASTPTFADAESAYPGH